MTNFIFQSIPYSHLMHYVHFYTSIVFVFLFHMQKVTVSLILAATSRKSLRLWGHLPRLLSSSTITPVGTKAYLKGTGENVNIIKKSGSWYTVQKLGAQSYQNVRVNQVTFSPFVTEPIAPPESCFDIITKPPQLTQNNDFLNVSPSSTFSAMRKWIIFSDLHVKGSSIECCEDVLKQVHREAKNRNAGIIFLGDFWHVRGAVSVELLNRVLQCLKHWEQPVILIPGNLSKKCTSSQQPLICL